MPLYFENRWLRTSLVFLLLSIFGLQIWYLFVDQPARFAALASANVFTVQKVVEFEQEVKKFKEDNDQRFDDDELKRRANMNSWVSQSTETLNAVRELMEESRETRAETRANTAIIQDYVTNILNQVQATHAASRIAREQAAATHEKLNQKIVTEPEADQLKKQAAALKKQNKELKKKKAVPVFKLFLKEPQRTNQ
jgi:hypothetical protein